MTTPAAKVRVLASAWLGAVELLEELAERAGGAEPCPLCCAPAGCSHDPDCLVARAAPVAQALAGGVARG